MIRPILKSIAAGGALAVALWAAPFWTAKPYTQWTEKEVEKLLGNSPWVQSAEVSFDMSAMPQGGMRGAGGGLGGPGGGMGAPGGGMGAPGGGMGGPGGGGMGGPGGGMQMPSAYVMWQSALPVRRAMVRAAQLKESPAAPELEKQLENQPTHHILAVMGLQAGPGMRRPGGDGQRSGGQGGPSPEQMAEMRARMETQMKENTILTIDGTKLFPEKIETVLSGTERVLMFYFAKDAEFTARTKTMQFQTQMGPMKVSAKFKPKDMLE